jgi:hypothetical protein
LPIGAQEFPFGADGRPYVEDGTIDLSLTLAALGIDDVEELSPKEKQATIYDLLTARSGIYHPAGYETPWMESIKPQRHSHAPGTWWCYSNWDFNALSARSSRSSPAAASMRRSAMSSAWRTSATMRSVRTLDGAGSVLTAPRLSVPDVGA